MDAEWKQLCMEMLHVSLKFWSIICTSIVWDVKESASHLWGEQVLFFYCNCFSKENIWDHRYKKEEENIISKINLQISQKKKIGGISVH